MEVEKEQLIELARKQNNAMHTRYSTQYSQYTYKIGQIHFLNNFTYFLIWIYFILAAIYLGILIVSEKRNNFSMYYKVGVFLTIIVFPYIITPIEMFIMKMCTFVIETIVGKVFERPDHEFVINYNSIPNIFNY